MQQLPLNIVLDQEVDFAAYLIGKNHFLIDFLKSLSLDKSEFVYLWGDAGSGKSHLIQAMANRFQEAAFLPLAEPELVPEMLLGMESFPLVCIDDIDAVVADSAWAEGLFHLYNRIKDVGGSLVISANAPPTDLAIELADLQSRLSAMTVFKIQPLSDNDKQVLLQQKAAAKGLTLGSEVAQYMMSRSSRDLHHLMRALDRLDTASLISQRKITVPLVKDVLKI
ncbi:MAG: DnaA regulatory inactivator Hda [Gammaproteobacteria bacterium]|nr:DnaA regulatory inactivator Hda [Gammaproteobacteria bacterium]